MTPTEQRELLENYENLKYLVKELFNVSSIKDFLNIQKELKTEVTK